MTITEKITSFIAETNFEDLPPEIITITKRAMIDTIGVALAGSVYPAGKAITEFVEKFGCKPVAGVIGEKVRTSSPLAALANGTKAHMLDYDDCKAGCRGHPSAVIIPTVLALGEEVMASGRDLIVAYVLGVEIWAKMSKIIPEHLILKGWHPMAVLGTVGAAVAAAKLLKLNADKVNLTLGIACSEAAGLSRNFGTMTKPLHAGNAAKNGIMSALLVNEGFTASRNILEGDSNFLLTFYGNEIGDVSEIAESFGSPYGLISPSLHVKQYATCASSHRAVDAILYLANEYNIRPKDVEAVTCLSTPLCKKNLRYSSPRTALEAKFSMPFAIATSLIDRKLGLAQVTDEKVNDPVIKSLMAKVTLAVHPDWVKGKDSGDTRPDVVTVKLKNGKEYSHKVSMPKGTGANPLTEKELLAKYRECAKLVLDSEAIEQCIDLVWELERLENIEELMQMVSGKR